MNSGHASPSKYISAADLLGIEARVVISHVIEGKALKWVVYFRNKEKGLLLNSRLNLATISRIFGLETDRWRGKEVVLHPIVVMIFGRPTEIIRVRVPADPSRYLKADDLEGRESRVVISHVVGSKICAPFVVYFNNNEKGLLLNKSNQAAISRVHGCDTAAWAGAELVLYPTRVKVFGTPTEIIGVRLPAPEQNKDIAERAAASGPL
jgi:hypothetical protein